MESRRFARETSDSSWTVGTILLPLPLAEPPAQLLMSSVAVLINSILFFGLETFCLFYLTFTCNLRLSFDADLFCRIVVVLLPLKLTPQLTWCVFTSIVVSASLRTVLKLKERYSMFSFLQSLSAVAFSDFYVQAVHQFFRRREHF